MWANRKSSRLRACALALACASLPCGVPSRAAPAARSAARQSPAQAAPPELTAAAPARSELAAGQSHTYRVALEAGQYLRVVVEPSGPGLVLTLHGPAGETVFRLDCLRGEPNAASLVAPAAGAYRLELRPSGKGAGGAYEVRIAEARPATAADRRRVAAERAFAEAERLRAEWKAETRLRAVAKYEEARLLWNGCGEKSGEAAALRAAGDAYRQMGEPQTALSHYQRALDLSRQAGDARGEVRALNAAAGVYTSLGEHRKAQEACDRALAASVEGKYARGQAAALNNLGDVHAFRGEPRRALDFYRRALPLWQSLEDREGLAQTLLFIGYSFSDLGDTEQAGDFYRRALSLWQGLDDVRGQALTLTAIAHLHNKWGEKQAALDLYQKAAALFRRTGDRVGEARTLNGVGYVYNSLNERQKAVEHYGRALELCRGVSLPDELANTFRLGELHSALGRREQAHGFYRAALALAENLSDRRSKSYILRNVGALHEAAGDLRAAQEHYRQALALQREGADRLGEALTLAGIGGAHAAAGEHRQAAERFAEALALHRAVRNPAGEAQALYELARAARALGELDAARARVEEALKIGDTLREKVAGHELRASYFTTVHQQYEFYVEVQMRLHAARPSEGFDRAAFEAAERGRARSLLEALAEGRKDIRRGVDAELLGRERELQRQLHAKAERRVQLAAAKAAPEELALVERELNDLAARYQETQGQIRASSPHYAALVRPAPLTLAEIQRKVLDADTVLLEYALGEERSHVWAVTPDSVKSFALPPRAEVEAAARRVYELLTARNRRVKGEAWPQTQARLRREEAEYEEASAALGRMLLAPVARELGRKRIAVVADGALQYVPFAALPDPNGSESQAPTPEPEVGTGNSSSGSGLSFTPLIVGHEVVSLPSASVLALLRDELRGRAPAPKAVAVLADPVFEKDDERLTTPRARPRAAAATRGGPQGFEGPGDGGELARLPFSRREAEAIMASVPAGEGLLATDFRASRATATGPELSRYRVVHFATHGLLDSEHPELSGVVLSLFDEAGRRQDGFLQLHEVYNLNLPAELVVLSACQTALGKEVRGEGLIGLTRGFMYAGSPRVVASLWKVDDAATAELMGEFYRAMLREGLRPAEALRAAQVGMWRRPQRRSPYYWAAFTLQGEWR